jgi:hypothetical protein
MFICILIFSKLIARLTGRWGPPQGGPASRSRSGRAKGECRLDVTPAAAPGPRARKP